MKRYTPSDLNTIVSTNGAWIRISRICLSQHFSTSLDDIQTLPYHWYNWTHLHVFYESRKKWSGREVSVMLLQEFLISLSFCHERLISCNTCGHTRHTCLNLRATSLNPFCSKRLMTSPTMFRWTPSGLIMMNVRSLFADMTGDNHEYNARRVQIIHDVTIIEWEEDVLMMIYFLNG